MPTLLLGLAVIAGCSDVVEPPEPVTITVGPTLSLEVGDDFQLSLRGGVGEASWESSAPSVVSVVAVTGYVRALSAGSATITGRRGDQAASVVITTTLPPLLDLTPADVEFRVDHGSGLSETRRLDVHNTGGGTLGSISVDGVDYGENEGGGWLISTVDGQGVVLRADATGLSSGVYTAVVRVSAERARNAPQTAAVTLVVTGTPVIGLSPSALGLVVIQGQSLGVQEVVASNVGEGTLAGLSVSIQYGAGQNAWLGIPQVVHGANGGVIRFSPTTAGLPLGSYSAQVTVHSSTPQVESVTLPVTLTVTLGPAIVLTPAAVVFSVVTGSAAPPPVAVAISNGGGGTLSGLSRTVSYTSSAGWLTTTLSGTTAPVTLQLQADPGSRLPGTYTATVQVSSPVAGNSPTLLPVTLHITTPPVLSLSPSTLNLEALVGAGTVLDRTIQITNSGGGTIGGITASSPVYVSGASGWLSILETPGSTAPTQLRLRAATAGLASGVYQARVTISSTTPGVNPLNVTVNLTVLHTFTTHVRPIMSGYNCGGCHAGSPDFRNTLSNAALYQQVMNYVSAGNPDGSTFYRRLAPGTGVSHSVKVTAAEGLVIRQWILRGARF